ncbi:pyruvate, phosphate dikinase, partial [Roseateles sp. GG27B]
MTAAIDTFAHAIEHIDPNDTARFGGKATGLARMAAAGIPVPPAFVIGTDGYRAFRASGSLPADLMQQTLLQMSRLELAAGKRFGATDSVPLLVSVRSGAQISMPGMMDTVLNLGITAGGAWAIAQATGNVSFALDTWMRFWRMFCDIVLDLDGDALARDLEGALTNAKRAPTADAFDALEAAVLSNLAEQGAHDVEADPQWQLRRAIAAVFESWDSRRAHAYREHHKIADNLGTAVTVQAMVFGNLDARSGSGVAFTRDPNTGEATLYGEFLACCQGEDLVSGIATPTSLADPSALSERHRQELHTHGQQLERMYSDAVDIEFTVEGSQLFFLQVRTAKRTAQAAVRIAAELVDNGIVGPDVALQKVSIEQLKRLLRPLFEPAALAAATVLTQGIAASPGHSYGVAVLDSDRAATLAASGQRVVLLRPTTSPQDIRGMLSSQAIVTGRGGALSHAAVVSRALDLPCIVGCEALEIQPDQRWFKVGNQRFEEGAPLSVDGASGRVYSGVLPLESAAHAVGHIEKILAWADLASGVDFWVAGVNGGDAQAALRHGPRGL